jgi:hypothetical protein
MGLLVIPISYDEATANSPGRIRAVGSGGKNPQHYNKKRKNLQISSDSFIMRLTKILVFIDQLPSVITK